METELRKTIDYNEVIRIDGQTAATCNGNINATDPDSTTVSFAINNQALYKANRDEIAAERAKFEDMIWTEQEGLKNDDN